MERSKKQKMTQKKIRVFEAFAGYGGSSFGLKKSKIPHEVVGYSEIDKYACQIYELNHKGIKNYGDITKIKPQELPDFDMFTGGFPCQPFSMAGKRLGEMDTRGTLFHDIMRICEIKKPNYVLLENVKGITFKNHENTFKKILSEFERLGYDVSYEILNSKDYGIPQNRERVWIFASKKKIPEEWSLKPKSEALKTFFSDIVEKKVEAKYYLNEKQIKRLIEKTKVDLEVKEPLCFDIYNKKIRNDNVSITLTEPHHNTLRVVEPRNGEGYVVRKLTPKEHFRLMGFSDNEINFGDLSDTQLCKLAGNGWDVNVVKRIMSRIYDLIE